ncbi:glycosyltransferase family 4 protein [Ornithinimicrobium tianjinense]|uniref:D-inositol 3-phosphate glycosyltransferase n=1 Tax=Ornithinimicrobium tianjinense TaxID=1195761 RepID=A0A917BUL7_9MICO|nr:glycosyltransferase family 4 protein [Ornithinimicrobium tianjinense]GGF57396.1 glycosyl transferase [Ornithinimicrobium tianjinense]
MPDRPPTAPSGGDRYDAALASALAGHGVRVRTVRAAGGWPWPDGDALRALGEVLVVGGRQEVVLVDGLVGCAAPDELQACAWVRPTAVLLHSRLSVGAGETGERAALLDEAEARALGAVGLVVVPSGRAAAEVGERYRIAGGRVLVAPPGVDPAPVSAGSQGIPQLLTLAAVTPLKNHGLLLEALAGMRDLPWRAVLAGPQPDAAHLRRLRARAAALGLEERVSWPGAVVGEVRDRVWAATDLLVHPSRSETYGLVVTEAHARGIPTVVGRGTGAEEALGAPDRAGGPPGAAVDVGGPEEMVRVLRRWLTDGEVRRGWRAAALARRGELPGWDVTAGTVTEALEQLAGVRR